MILLVKTLGVNVADLMGGAQTDHVPSYYATGVGAPDDIARLAQEKRDEGYPRLQIKVGGRPVEIDIETIRKSLGGLAWLWRASGRGWQPRLDHPRCAARQPRMP